MTKTIFHFILLMILNTATSQEFRFDKVLDFKKSGNVAYEIVQDKQHYIWFNSLNKGLSRFDGYQLKAYNHDPGDINTLADDYTSTLCFDSSNILWIGFTGEGLDRFDPESEVFTHFKHDPSNQSSLACDTVTDIIQDHLGNIWIATARGLDMYDKQTGKFLHYVHNRDDTSSLSGDYIEVLFEDKSNNIWAGSSPTEKGIGSFGSLNRLDKSTGKFTRFIIDKLRPSSVTSLYEDSKGNFWIGTAINGLYWMNRQNGKISRPEFKPEKNEDRVDTIRSILGTINFITEDIKGEIWIGTQNAGVNRLNPVTKELKHFGIGNEHLAFSKDTITGFSDHGAFRAYSSRDGILWITSAYGNLYNINLLKSYFPYYSIKQEESNSLYFDKRTNALWIATGQGLLRRDINNNKDRVWKHDPKNPNSLSSNIIYSLRHNEDGSFWLSTLGGGLCKFDPSSNTFRTYKRNDSVSGSLSSNYLSAMHIDKMNDLWVCTSRGVDRFDAATGLFTNYRNKPGDSTSLSNLPLSLANDRNNTLWVGTVKGLNRLDKQTGRFSHFLPRSSINSICIDANNVVWAGAEEGLYFLDAIKKNFVLYQDPRSTTRIREILHIVEDDDKNLWISTRSSIVKIDGKLKTATVYKDEYGVLNNPMGWGDNYKADDGRIFLGHYYGYYIINPREIREDSIPPKLNFAELRVGDEIIKVGKGNIISSPIWTATEVNLLYNQNTFSFDFSAIDYTSKGERNFLFKLENYETVWHDLGRDHRAYFFNVPPGDYYLKVKCISSDFQWSEKKIRIIITPPWWKTWWAYILYILFTIAFVWSLISYRSRTLKKENVLLEAKVANRTEQLTQSLEELKSAQTQLIQSEKMASLGELTAGIAHEIQNPLNFVNNFSEVNAELIVELRQEIEKGNIDEVKLLAADIEDNEQKIMHHGKRADAIVKGMLQHSRKNNATREPTDINALADEYFRLSYQGLRAKDKGFNASTQSNFDKEIGLLTIVPQDIGRVLLNIFNNAFYAVNEKMKQGEENYKPVVSVETRRAGGNIEIRIRDNGSGIPQKLLDKIFQPFFTTKPTGQGTGLGLSLSYDIIKAHGGELIVETVEGVSTEFIIKLPFNDGKK